MVHAGRQFGSAVWPSSRSPEDSSSHSRPERHRAGDPRTISVSDGDASACGPRPYRAFPRARGRGLPVPRPCLDRPRCPLPCGHQGGLTYANSCQAIAFSVATLCNIPVLLPARSNRLRISRTCSLECSAHREQRNKVMPAGVAGGRTKLV